MSTGINIPQITRDPIYGVRRAALDRSKKFPTIVNDAIDQANRRGSRFVKIPRGRREDAEELAAFINGNSKFKAEVLKEGLDEEDKKAMKKPDNRPVGEIGFDEFVKCIRTSEVMIFEARYSVIFEMPDIPDDQLAQYQAECKAYQDKLKEKQKSLEEEQRRAGQGNSLGFGFGGAAAGGYGGGRRDEILLIDGAADNPMNS